MASPEPAGQAGIAPRIPLRRNQVLLVASGSIGVTQLPDWIVQLRARLGWSVRVCLTHSADQLSSRRALAAVSQHPVAGPAWPTIEGVVGHHELAEWADLVIVAPATLNFIAKCATAMADSLALSTVITTTAPVLVAPGLPENAVSRPSVQRNLKLLEEDGYHVLPMEQAYSVHKGASIATGLPRLTSILRRAERVVGDRAGEHKGAPPT
jgi:phosphopantothenoylcysteine decarboxylase/phosphopantothenate--cysteine ligase